MNKFWRWTKNEVPDLANPEELVEERTLHLEGNIADESWFGDEVTPENFRGELNSGKGNITVWINSCGGDCFAAAQIYNMLRDYLGKVTVKIDGIAASAASVIAMAGDEVLVSPVSNIMIHNPATVAFGDHVEMEKAIAMLEEVKNSIINAYQEKTHLSRAKLSKLMEDETWLNAQKAIDLGFADGYIQRKTDNQSTPAAQMFSTKNYIKNITNKLNEHFHTEPTPEPAVPEAEPVVESAVENSDSSQPENIEAHVVDTVDTAPLYDRLREIKNKF